MVNYFGYRDAPKAVALTPSSVITSPDQPLKLHLPPRSVLTRLGWSAGSFGVLQVMRVGVNVVLTRLLAPQIFGVMTIINTLRTGMELLTDIGVNQNIVSSRNGDNPEFLNTAWTLQILRGPLLALIFIIAAWPLSIVYKEPDMRLMLQATSLFMIVSGIVSVGRSVAERRQSLPQLAKYEFVGAIFQGVLFISLAYVWPSAWAIIWGSIISGLFNSLLSYVMFPGFNLKLRINRTFAIEILSFGKWIFVSSIFFFIATNFDRLYLGAVVPLAALGVYGVARSMAEIIGALVTRAANLVVFPTVAALRDDRAALRQKLRHNRRPLLVLAAIALAGLAAISDPLIEFMYDARYHSAGNILPALAVGVWFTVLTMTGEAVLLGLGKPSYGTLANFTKLIWLVFALPLGIMAYGLPGAVVAAALADGVRYAPVMWAQRREGVSFLTFDLGMTLIFLVLVLAFREFTGIIGLTGGLSKWLDLARGADLL